MVALIAASLMSVFAATSLAGSNTAINILPTPEELPAHTVAVVSHIPVESRTLTTAELSRAIAQVAAQSRLKMTPAPGQPKYKALEEEALGELLDGLWILGQAVEMGVSVTDKQVSVELAQIKKESFKTEKQFRSYLKRSHLTMRDVRYRVELQLLSTRIQERILRGVRSQKEAQEKLSAFLAAYSKRWRSRTVCAPRYATEQCSNGPAPKTEFSR
jgi:SurA N-terminal domain